MNLPAVSQYPRQKSDVFDSCDSPLAMFSKSCFTKQIELLRIPRIREREETSVQVIQPVKDCVALLEAFERAGTPRHVDGRFNGGRCT
jgi:hypothetical protein